MSKHTPGPWTASVASTVVGSLVTADKVHPSLGSPIPYNVAAVMPQKNKSECIANAALIAAAPDLLEACKLGAEPACSMLCPSVWKTADYPDGRQPHSDICKQITAAIAKADGHE